MTSNVARWISVIAHPFVMVALMVGVMTSRRGTARDVAANIGIVALFTILPLSLLIARQLRRGAWANADASYPHERPALYVVSLSGLVALVLYLAITRPGSGMLRGAVVTLILLLVCALATRWIKVSLHIAAAALAATAMILLGSPIGWIVAGVLPVLAWSRLILGRHKPIELFLGLVLGILAGVALHQANLP